MGEGYAQCLCGKVSPLLPSDHRRRKWMREVHKPEVLGLYGEGET